MKKNNLLFPIGLYLLAGSLLFAADPKHDHSSHESRPAKLKLNEGKKWPTDASLRKGMLNIKNVLEKHIPVIHNGKETNKDFDALAYNVQTELNYIFKNCKLDPKADAMIHIILLDILDAVKVLRKGSFDDRHEGAMKIYVSLNDYGTYFDHPGWTPLK